MDSPGKTRDCSKGVVNGSGWQSRGYANAPATMQGAIAARTIIESERAQCQSGATTDDLS